jgi:hypothetical protein
MGAVMKIDLGVLEESGEHFVELSAENQAERLVIKELKKALRAKGFIYQCKEITKEEQDLFLHSVTFFLKKIKGNKK